MSKKKKVIRVLIILKLLSSLAVFMGSILFCSNEAQAAERSSDMHFTDTLRSPNKQEQFLKAIELAPEIWIYSKIEWKDSSTVTIHDMKFNKSLQNTLQADIVASDAKLSKSLRRIYKVTKALNPTCDLTVSYHRVPAGIAVSYDIRDIRIFTGN